MSARGVDVADEDFAAFSGVAEGYACAEAGACACKG